MENRFRQSIDDSALEDEMGYGVDAQPPRDLEK